MITREQGCTILDADVLAELDADFRPCCERERLNPLASLCPNCGRHVDAETPPVARRALGWRTAS